FMIGIQSQIYDAEAGFIRVLCFASLGTEETRDARGLASVAGPRPGGGARRADFGSRWGDLRLRWGEGIENVRRRGETVTRCCESRCDRRRGHASGCARAIRMGKPAG